MIRHDVDSDKHVHDVTAFSTLEALSLYCHSVTTDAKSKIISDNSAHQGTKLCSFVNAVSVITFADTQIRVNIKR